MTPAARKRRSVQLARNFYRSLPEIACPVDIRRIYRLMDWELCLAAELKGKTEGVTFHYGGRYRTYLPQSSRLKTSGRLRFTLGHEIGHIVLGHFQDFRLEVSCCREIGHDLIEILNQEANFFCSEFLMPSDQIRAHLRQGKKYLRNLFGVSEQALTYRLDNLGYGFLFDKQGEYIGHSKLVEEYAAVCLDEV